MSRTDYSQRVQAGITWLDSKFPDWLDQVEFPCEIDNYSSNRNVLTFILHIDFNLISQGFEKEYGADFMTNNGFSLESIYDESRANNPLQALEYEYLNEEWRHRVSLLKIDKQCKLLSDSQLHFSS